MTSKDKTSDKLLASIRKSKTGAATRKAPETAEVAKTAEINSAAGQTASATASASRNVRKPEKTVKNQVSFSHGRRVWPD